MQLRALTQTVPTTPAAAPAAPAAPAEGPTSAPLDELIRGSQTSSSSAPVVENPWPELAKLSVLGGTVAVPGPLGPALTDSARKNLKAMFERLEAKGVKIQRRRMMRLPFVMDKTVALNPEQAVERLGKQKAQFKRLEAMVPGDPNPVILSNLKDLRALDALYGAGLQEVAPAQAESVAILDEFRKSGWTVQNSDYYYYEENPSSTALQAYRRLEDGRALRVAKGDKSFDVKTAEDLRSLEFFVGTGQDHGLKDPILARRLKEAEAKGLRFTVDNRNSTPRDVYLIAGAKMGVALKDAEYHINIKAADLADADAMKSRLDEFEKVYAKIIRPALESARMADWGVTPATVLFPDDPINVEARAAVFAEIFSACASTNDRNSMQGALNVYTAVRKGAPNAFELARRAKLVVPTVRSSGADAAVEFMKRAKATLDARGGSQEADEKVQETFYKILTATGSVEAAFEGVDLVRIAVGSERFEERLGIFLMIAARESESTLPQTAEHFRSLLVHRDPKEGLVKTADRFMRLLEGMGVGRHQGRAPEVFAKIQADLIEGKITPSQADERVESFLRNLALSNEVDRAAEAMTSSAGGPAGDIKPGEDFVDIGGIRIPRSGG